ncbi:hypothetical protein SCLCIDRAFT_96312, partial [Scleroderma citrinum Foug A]
VEIEFEGAGHVIRMDETVHERWRRRFGDGDGDVLMDEVAAKADNTFAPFASELDWHVAHWVVQEGIGHKLLDRLLAIPWVS